MFTPELLKKAETILQSARSRGWKITTAESCTGGLISALLTEIPGSSDMFTHGFITYANAAKTQMIGVDEAVLKTYGAVSEHTARHMAEGALHTANADISVAVTGIAGPGGGTENKPVGLVHIASATQGNPSFHAEHIFSGDRTAIRLQAVSAALELLQIQFTR